MEQDYTANKLINLIYGECDLFERLELEHAMQHDYVLLEEYQSLVTAYRSLHKVRFAPRTVTLQNIMAYASNQQGATA